MKKCLLASLIFCIIFSLCACGGGKDNTSSLLTESETSSQVSAENNSSNVPSDIVSHPGNIQNPDHISSLSNSDAHNTSSLSQSGGTNSNSAPDASSSSSKSPITYIPSQNKIPAGCVYKSENGLYLTAGSMMPKEVCTGDKFEDADYIYCYNRVCDPMFGTDNWGEDKNAPEGWSVVVKDPTKASYGSIRKSINGKNVTSLYCTFMACTSLVSAPAIPDTVTYMYSTFALCEALTSAPKIPEGVTNMSAAFLGCEKLKTAPKLPESVRNLSETFKNCTILESAPKLPEGVTNMSATFYQCRAIKTAPRIPEKVLDMTMTFYECPLLEGEIVIDALPLYYDDCFRHTEKKITLTGKSEFLISLQRTSVAGNIDIKE